MVQGTVLLGQSASTSLNIQEYDKTAKKSGYDAIQKIEQEASSRSKASKSDPWGSTFKGQDHFKAMHIC